MNREQDKKNTTHANEQPAGNNRNLDDLFNDESNKVENVTPQEEAEAEQQRKEALTERD